MSRSGSMPGQSDARYSSRRNSGDHVNMNGVTPGTPQLPPKTYRMPNHGRQRSQWPWNGLQWHSNDLVASIRCMAVAPGLYSLNSHFVHYVFNYQCCVNKIYLLFLFVALVW